MVRSAQYTSEHPGGQFSCEDMEVGSGTRFYVGSTVTGASDATGYGLSPDSPFATLAYAFSSDVLTANVGDRVIVLEGHTEDVIAAAGLAMDIAGVKVFGLGSGTNKPTINLITSTDADVDVDAANIEIHNLRFVSGINSLKNILDCNAANLLVEDCDFVSSSTYECVCFVDIATTIDHFTFRRCTFEQPSDPEGTDGAAATGCFYFVDSQYILIEECSFIGEFETSIFHNRTTAATNLWIKDCWGEQALAGADVATLVAGATGGMVRCSWNVPDAGDATTWGSFCTVAADTPFGFHSTTFMNDNNAGEQLALPVCIATA